MLLDFGISREKFSTEYREKDFCLFRNALGQTGFGWEQLNTVIYCTELRSSFLQLYRGGVVPEELYMESYSDFGLPRRRIIKKHFYSYLADGATLILNRVDAKSPLIKRICAEVARFVGAQTLSNGYLAFGGEGSFGNHWDTHDVFAVQLMGRKHWRLYRPTFDLPLQEQTSKNNKQDCPTEPVFDGVLEQGDILYIPRGWWHNALPAYGETFHVAVGVHPVHVVDYFNWICANVLPRFVECRRSIPLEEFSHRTVLEAIDIVCKALSDSSNFMLFSQYVLERERIVMPFSLEKVKESALLDETSKIDVQSAYGIQAKLATLRVPSDSEKLPRSTANLVLSERVHTVAEVARLAGLSVPEVLSHLNEWMMCDLLEIRNETNLKADPLLDLSMGREHG